MRVSADVGGTFTDLVVESADGVFHLFKAPTTPADPVVGILDAVDRAAAAQAMTRARFFGMVDMFIHATTRSTNAILTNSTARTAMLTTAGHPDILVYREGGRNEPFNYTVRVNGKTTDFRSRLTIRSCTRGFTRNGGLSHGCPSRVSGPRSRCSCPETESPLTR